MSLGQRSPHAPQLFRSVASCASQPLLGFKSQSCQPGSQMKLQPPATHTGVLCPLSAHAVEQSPQKFGLVFVSTQEPPQMSSGQLVPHVPLMQNSPDGQAFPQRPQLSPSVF